MNALYANYLGSDYRPVGLTAGSRALVRVVDDLGWLCDRVRDDTAATLGVMTDPSVRVLRASARLLRIRPGRRPGTRAAPNSMTRWRNCVRWRRAATARTSPSCCARPTTRPRSRWAGDC